MRKLNASILAFAVLTLVSFAPPALAQTAQSHPGAAPDLMNAPAQEGDYGTGVTSTERMVERCTALEWSLQTNKEGEIEKYVRNYQSGYCLGWINSSMAYLSFHNEAGNHTLGVCMPEEINTVDVLKIFLDYVHANQEETKYNPSLLIYWALLEKYPCKN